MTSVPVAMALMGDGGEALARAHRLELLAVIFVRAGTLAILVAGAVGLWLKYGSGPTYHSDLLFVALCLALLAESVLVLGLCWRARRLRLGLMTLDVLCCVLALNVNAWASTTGWMSPDSFLVFTYSIPASLVIGVAFHRLLQAMAMNALLAFGGYLTASTVVWRNPHTAGPAWNLVFNIISYLAVGAVSWLVAYELRGMSRELDQARAEAVRQADNASRERERVEQLRTLHNRPLQTLEMLAGGDYIIDPEIQRLVTAEAAYLRALVESRDVADQPGDLLSGLRTLVEQQARGGLSVSLRAVSLAAADSAHRLLSPEAVKALLDAVFEALTDVREHAEVDRAEIRAVATADRVTLTVVDHGRGFPPAADPPRAVRDRIEAVGGSMSIESTPGEGTRVRLSVPVHGSGPARDGAARDGAG